MRLRFYLHNRKDKDKTHLIMAEYTHRGGKPWRFSTELKARREDWHKAEKRVLPTDSQAINKNSILTRLREDILAVGYEIKKEQKQPFPDLVKARYLSAPKAAEFWELYPQFYKFKQSQIQPGTLEKLQRAFYFLQAYELRTGRGVTFDQFRGMFYQGFIEFMKEAGLGKGTINNYLKWIRAFLRFCQTRMEIDISPAALVIPYQKPDKEPPRVWLSLEEIKQLRDHPTPPGILSEVKDLFLFQAAVGCRFGDLALIQTDWVQNGVLYFRNRKGRRNQKRELPPAALLIWEKYRGSLPRIGRRSMNKYIKIIARQIPLDGLVFDNGAMVPKYNLISTHAARRTCGNLLLREGYSLLQIRDILGHKNAKTTEIYLDVSGELSRPLG